MVTRDLLPCGGNSWQCSAFGSQLIKYFSGAPSRPIWFISKPTPFILEGWTLAYFRTREQIYGASLASIMAIESPVLWLRCVNSWYLNLFAYDLQLVTSIGLIQRRRRIHWKNRNFRNAGSWVLYWFTTPEDNSAWVFVLVQRSHRQKKITLTPARPKSNVVPAIQHIRTW